MFYRPEDGHGLPRDPLKALVAPRPIGWISTLAADGRANLAPYSFFNMVAEDPPMVMFCSTGGKPDRAQGKDSLSNVLDSGEFAANIVPEALLAAMNLTSGAFAAGTDEFALAGLEKAPCRVIAAPRVAGAPAVLECRLWRMVDLPGAANHMVIAHVVGVHVDDAILADGRVDVTRYRPVARLGYTDYAAVAEVFAMARPKV
jgi:flavin reductase (DIM6/NTAB) family NADH-FMN oxidoreductase RutF